MQYHWLFLAGFFLLPAGSHLVAGQDLGFSISMDKKTYTKTDAVKCSLTLRNKGTRNITVNSRLLVNLPSGPREVSLLITDPDNRLVPFVSLIRASFHSDEFNILKPGSTVTYVYSVSNDFLFVKTGVYSIIGYYENNDDPPASLKMPPAWKGTLVSNKSFFTLSW